MGRTEKNVEKTKVRATRDGRDRNFHKI